MRNKKILILSPQSWGIMRISKHHYAIEAAKMGNTVFFLNPPQKDRIINKISVTTSEESPNLQIIRFNMGFPMRIRFHWRGLYDVLMQQQVKWIQKKISIDFDVIWCFDFNLYSNLRWFKGAKYIYHPVDELYESHQVNIGKSADVILSVTTEILSKFQALHRPKHLIQHGLSSVFVESYVEQKHKIQESIQVGYVGNLLIGSLDEPIVTKIVSDNPHCHFHFWGSYKNTEANLGGSPTATRAAFLEHLQHRLNVTLHGATPTEDLARAMQAINVFLICYNPMSDHSGATNSHKVMEYLSTGKVIVSSNLTNYANRPDLLQMTVSRNNNNDLPQLFQSVVDNLDSHNAPEKQQHRRSFALENTYQRHIENIDTLL
jgi:hypothetical protein